MTMGSWVGGCSTTMLELLLHRPRVASLYALERREREI